MIIFWGNFFQFFNLSSWNPCACAGLKLLTYTDSPHLNTKYILLPHISYATTSIQNFSFPCVNIVTIFLVSWTRPYCEVLHYYHNTYYFFYIMLINIIQSTLSDMIVLRTSNINPTRPDWLTGQIGGARLDPFKGAHPWTAED